jgi:hypothetical protein
MSRCENGKWFNYGDANPLTWGGTWVMSDEEANGETFRGCYYIIKYTPENNEILDLYVDVNDSWLERESIMDYIGMTEETYDEIQYAIGCTDYYSYLNFGCNEPIKCKDEKDVIKELKKFGIKAE